MSPFRAYPSVGKTSEDGEKEQHRFSNKYPLRILVAEDNYINRRVLVLFLERLGYHPVTVENGVDCLRAALEERFDLILTDINMPGMDGFECASGIREAGIDIPILAVTANVAGDTLERCFHAGMAGCLAKPVNFEELQYSLRKAYLEQEAKRKKQPEDLRSHFADVLPALAHA